MAARAGWLSEPENAAGERTSYGTGWSRQAYQELINYSFVDAAWEADFRGGPARAISVINPIAAQHAVDAATTLLCGALVIDSENTT